MRASRRMSASSSVKLLDDFETQDLVESPECVAEGSRSRRSPTRNETSLSPVILVRSSVCLISSCENDRPRAVLPLAAASLANPPFPAPASRTRPEPDGRRRRANARGSTRQGSPCSMVARHPGPEPAGWSSSRDVREGDRGGLAQAPAAERARRPSGVQGSAQRQVEPLRDRLDAELRPCPLCAAHGQIPT